MNRNEAGGERGVWDQEEVNGNWRVSIKKGYYDIKFKFIKPLKSKWKDVFRNKYIGKTNA